MTEKERRTTIEAKDEAGGSTAKVAAGTPSGAAGGAGSGMPDSDPSVRAAASRRLDSGTGSTEEVSVHKVRSESDAVYEYLDPDYLPPGDPPAQDWVYLPRRLGRLPRVLMAIGAVVLLVGGLVWGVTRFTNSQLYPGEVSTEAYLAEVDTGGDTSQFETVDLHIAEASTLTDVANQLATEDVVRMGPLWRIWAQRKGIDTVDAGDYVFPLNADADLVAEVLERGPAEVFVAKYQVIEGRELQHLPDAIASTLDWVAPEDVSAVIDSGVVTSSLIDQAPDANLEGLLFPSTYDADPAQNAQSMLQRMADTMVDKTEALNYGPAAASFSYIESPYDLVVVASLIEREARTAIDRDRISPGHPQSTGRRDAAPDRRIVPLLRSGS